MKITNIKIKNFRLLDEVELNLEDITTAIVGKNNSGKTSFSEIFNIFMNDGSFKFEDFSFTCHKIFKKVYEKYLEINEVNKEEKTIEILKIIPKIKLILKVEYTKEDNWINIKPFMNSLDDSNELNILFEYLPKDTLKLLANINKDKDCIDEFRTLFKNNYQVIIRPYSDVEKTKILKLSDVKKLLQCHFIEAQRDLEEGKSSNTKLSSIFQRQYDYKTKKDDKGSDELIVATKTANDEIEVKLKGFFKEFIDSFKSFGFPRVDKETLELQSNLEIENLFRNNVKLVYNHDGNILPEKYNGLGYKNLMYIISKILSFQIMHQDQKSDLNLLFIEEPEAHMHPQMQTVFIKNITKFLDEKGFNVQVILSTHSSHILTNAKFESIRYFTKSSYSSKVKDLRKFHTQLSDTETLKFLEQYLTLDKGELFFSDKAILFEGVVERLLMPVFIQKLDAERTTNLSEQYISYIEIGGAYMNKFKELLEFLEIKTLIITDIDSVDSTQNNKKCKIEKNSDLVTSNSCLKNWLPKERSIEELLRKGNDDKTINKIRVAYQTKKSGEEYKCGRSFEEAFIIDNSRFIFSNKDEILSIKNNIKQYSTEEKILENSYEIQDYIDKNKKKTDFAFDLLSKKEGWIIPRYIEEGLRWLSQK